MKQLKLLSLIYFAFLFLNYSYSYAQSPYIKSMKWGKDLKIKLELVNDSVYILNAKELYHSSGESVPGKPVYYPVSLSNDLINKLKGKNISDSIESKQNISFNIDEKPKTLWSAIHYKIGGGWTHFLNCMLYALETRTLDITSPLMRRPESTWKPKPMTETYKRTRKWDFYIPVNQKLAIKEYKIRKKKGELGDIKNLPENFIKLFLETNQKDYEELLKNYKRKERAKVELIKVLLGANYLGQAQIQYISNAVFSAAIKYSANQLPSVIILDDYKAAVAMTIDEHGYRVERIVFADEDLRDEHDLAERRNKINNLIHNINDINRSLFEKRLKQYYQK